MLEIHETVIETRVEGYGDNLVRKTHLYTKPSPGFPGRLLCQRYGYISHEGMWQEFLRDNAADDAFGPGHGL